MNFAEWARGNTIVLIVAGSRLYGTAREDSDRDFRGVCFDPAVAITGIQGFNQYEHITKDHDEVIYGVSKFLNMCLVANPSVLDILFAPAASVVFKVPEWDQIHAARHSFLSTKVIHTFCGYAYSQLKRIERHKRWLDNPPPKPHLGDFGLRLYTTQKGGQQYEPIPLKYNFALGRFPYVNLRSVKAAARRRTVYAPQDRTAMIAAYKRAEGEYKKYAGWRENRNPARAVLEQKYGYDVKHAGHLVRLLEQGANILRTGTYDPVLGGGTLEMVLLAMNGELEYEQLVSYAKAKEQAMRSMATKLPRSPDLGVVHALIRRFALASLSRDEEFRTMMEGWCHDKAEL